MKKFIHFQHSLDFRQYCEAIKKFVSIDVNASKELFFNFLDKNKDKKVCETDLFNVIKSIESFKASDMILPDILIALKFIEDIRKTLGKNDEQKMRKLAI
jgi:Ca2+-binding EF-hand superfamily protein